MLSVYDFIDLCITDEQVFSLWDNATESVIWTGTKDDLPDEYEYLNVWSFDGVLKDCVITLNFDTAEE